MSDFKRLKFPANIFKLLTTKSRGNLQTTAGQGNEAIDMVDWINQGIDEGFIQSAGGGDLSIANKTSTTLDIANSAGDDVTVPAATTSDAGLLTAADKTKLNGLTNYTHPNHSGDVVSAGDGATTIQQDVVSNEKLANMNGNTVKLRSASTPGDPMDFSLLPNKLLGRGSDNIAQIGLSGDFAIVADTLTFIGTSGGSSLSNYLTTVTNANAGSTLNVFASAAVTAEWITASNRLEITIPSGVKLLYADWRMVTADIQATADAGGATNWIQVKFIGTSGNTSLTDLKVPNVQKTNLPATGTLSVTNAGSIDIDNNPLITPVGVGSNTITLRVQGLAIGSQGYHLKFSNIS